jgi:hypothetical protein
MLVPALVVVASLSAQVPDAPTPVAPPPPGVVKATVVVVDDRATKDQAPAAWIAKTIAELGKRKGIAIVRMSEGRRRLDARADKALQGCGDDAGCLATAVRDMGGDIVVTVRLTKREGAFFLALTRISALRPQMTDDAGTLAGNENDALAFIPEAVGDLFADVELIAPPASP